MSFGSFGVFGGSGRGRGGRGGRGRGRGRGGSAANSGSFTFGGPQKQTSSAYEAAFGGTPPAGEAPMSLGHFLSGSAANKCTRNCTRAEVYLCLTLCHNIVSLSKYLFLEPCSSSW